jgi:alkanesulfonate monooxygenase SsuD/methylene tetrahydromethanopterin reductase-like flavin-dependent oxidoreductase (luciferase family)
MEFGIFHEFPSLPGRSHAEAFAQSFELVDGAERWGLDAMWLGELHFDPARSVLSSPLCVASAIAARTQRMKIGLAVQVLPLCHPLRLAEEAATVDQISKGRLIFGVGRSGVARTYEAYGVPYAESRERFTEILDIVQKAWTQDEVSYQGRYHRFENVAVVPKPYQQPTPPIRVAATSADTFVSIGRQGLPIFVAVRYETAPEIAPHVAAYREAVATSAEPQRGGVFLPISPRPTHRRAQKPSPA